MKKIISIMLSVILLIVPTRVSASPVDEYKEWLKTNHNSGISYEDTADMWEAFLEHITVFDEDVQALSKTSNAKGIYKVDTLAGGNGTGFKNGDKKNAKINITGDMITTKNNDIYFIDDANKTIRKIDYETKLVSNAYTLVGAQNVTFEENNKTYDYKNGYINKLGYNPLNDTVYFGTAYNAGQNYALTTIRKLDVRKTLIAYDNHTKFKAPYISYADFMVFEGNKIWFSERFGLEGNPSYILTADANETCQEASVFTTANYDHPELSDMKKLRGRNDVIITSKYIYIYDTYYKELRQIDKTTKKQTVIARHNLFMSAVVAANNKFYLSYNSTIYEMDLEGNTKVILDNDNYNSPIKGIVEMAIDNKKELIVSEVLSYDQRGNATNVSLKRININK